MKIYRMGHTTKAPRIYAVPDHRAFVANVLADLGSLKSTSAMPAFKLAAPEVASTGFYLLSKSVLVFSRAVYLGPLGVSLDLAGDTHRSVIEDTGQEVYLLNVTARYNCLDSSRTQYVAPGGRDSVGIDHGMGIKSPAFYPELIGDSWIFKLPNILSTIYVASDATGTAEDFYFHAVKQGVHELEFEAVWDQNPNAAYPKC